MVFVATDEDQLYIYGGDPPVTLETITPSRQPKQDGTVYWKVASRGKAGEEIVNVCALQ